MGGPEQALTIVKKTFKEVMLGGDDWRVYCKYVILVQPNGSLETLAPKGFCPSPLLQTKLDQFVNI
jgi:hypothetical protein